MLRFSICFHWMSRKYLRTFVYTLATKLINYWWLCWRYWWVKELCGLELGFNSKWIKLDSRISLDVLWSILTSSINPIKYAKKSILWRVYFKVYTQEIKIISQDSNYFYKYYKINNLPAINLHHIFHPRANY